MKHYNMNPEISGISGLQHIFLQAEIVCIKKKALSPNQFGERGVIWVKPSSVAIFSGFCLSSKLGFRRSE